MFFQDFRHVRSRILSPQSFRYMCAASGIIFIIFVLVGMAVAGFLPPMAPVWGPEETVGYYRKHEKGIQVGAAFILVSGMFYIPLTVLISAQMRLIPNLDYTVSALQLAAGVAGVWIFLLAGLILAVANYRLERAPEITQALNDLFWMMLVMPWPSFMVQGFSFAYAILTDPQPRPRFPKPMAIINIIAPILYVPASAVHCVRTGPAAWNGAVAFYIPLVAFCLQVLIDSIGLLRVISSEQPDCSGDITVKPLPGSITERRVGSETRPIVDKNGVYYVERGIDGSAAHLDIINDNRV